MKRRIAAILVSALAALAPSAPAAAQASAQDKPWRPDGPVTLILAFGAGGGHYALAQILQARLSEELGQPFIVMPKPGGGGLIATDFIFNARPDGRTIAWSPVGALTIWPQLRRVSYDPEALTPVALLVKMGFMLLTQPDNKDINTLQDVIALSKQRDLTYSSVGIGTSNSMAGHLLNARTGSKLREIGYKSGGPALLSTMAGETSLAVGDTASHELIESGRLKAIATTSLEREPRFPDVPAIAETVPGYEVSNWLGVMAPPGTPANIVARYRDVFAKVMAEPAIVERVRQLGMTPSVGTSQALGDLIRSDSKMWKQLIADQNIKVE